jgi:hypothetical protein
MIKKFVGLLGAVASFVAAAPAEAQWLSFTANNDGAEFWDNLSSDGATCNIGYVVTGVAGSVGNRCNNQRPLNWLPFAGPAMTQFWGLPTFTRTGGALIVKIGQGIGGDIAGQNRDWGFWTLSGVTKVRTNVNIVSASPQVYAFATDQQWGFWVSTTDNTFRYSDVDPQFAMFRGADDEYVVGLEDVLLPNGDQDYQDMIASFTIVPEPASAALVLTGLAGLAGIVSRRRRA